MRKSLKEFTKKDWDTLFPVKLVEHRPEWGQTFEVEKQKILQSTSSKYFDRVVHFGSSSIPNLKSKPYIDIIIEVPKQFLYNEQMIGSLESIGYTCLTERIENDDNHYMIFVKGYNLDGTSEQIFHLHLCPKEHSMMEQIKFRDYLITNPERAKEYENLKVRLASKFKNDRSGYRIAKTEFITETLKMFKGKSMNNKV